jgi:mannose/fructose/N-acetylgalactosamine-specific phosphotransferase system component IIC
VSGQFALLLLWGTFVGLDLVSVGQAMFARPIVAGTVGGVILGDPVAGATVGAILELFALDVLPVGAARYPDYGVGAVAASATAAHAPAALGIGLAVCVGLAVAYMGEVGIRIVRRGNTVDVRRLRDALDEGDVVAVVATHTRGFLRDALRSLVVTALGLVLALGVYRWSPVSLESALLVTVVVMGAAVGSAAGGLVSAVGRGTGLRWFGVGLAAGLLGVVLL